MSETLDLRILTASYMQDGNEPVVELFGRSGDGRSVTVLAYGTRPYLFVVEPDPGLAESLRKDKDVLSVEGDNLYIDGAVRNVIKITITYPWLMSDFKSRIQKKYRILAGDIPFHHRFFYDKDMGSCIRVTGEVVEKDYFTDVVLRMESFENIEPFDPGLRVLSFDIENSVLHDYIFTICSVIWENGTIRGCEPIVGAEKDIIKGFADLIRKEDPDVITGYNIENYDIKKIVERATVHKMQDELKWGRDGSTPRIIGGRYWRVKGRMVVDAWWAAKRELRPKQETLNAVAMQVLGEMKIDVDPKYMDTEWANDREHVIEYCTKDAELSLRILLEVDTLRKGLDLAAVSKLPVDDVLTSGTSTLVDSILIRAADREKIGVPMNGNRTRGEQIEGGYVHAIKPGLYHWVCVLDFKSMYPSLIISKNICFTTLSKDGEIVSPNGVRYLSKERRMGLLPRILKELMEERDRIKTEMKGATDTKEEHYLDGLQAAVKILMNTFYGVFASSFYRFTDKSIGSSITAFARNNVKSIISTLTEEGDSIIYSDTDSIFVQSPAEDLEGSVEYGKGLADRFSKEEETLVFEKILEPLFTHGKKKRYVGRVVWPKWEDELLVRGYEIRRSDSFNLQSDLLMDLFEKILEEKNEEAVAIVRDTIRRVMSGLVPASDLVISRTCKGLDAYQNPDSMANVQAAAKMVKMGYDFIPGMKVSWIVTDSKTTPQTVEPYISGKEFGHMPDYKYYAERLASTASRVTEVFGWDEKDLLMGSQQSTLFDGGFDTPARKEEKLEVPPKKKATTKGSKLSDFF
jgi:DNA polymerase I